MRKKGKIYGHLPIFATAKFSIEKPENWDEMTKAEQDEYFLASSTLKSEASLCHQCNGDIETDFEFNDEGLDEDLPLYEDDA